MQTTPPKINNLNKLFSLNTDKISLFKKIFNALKEIMIETNLQISSNCITIQKSSIRNTIFLFLKLFNNKINEEENNFVYCAFPEENTIFVGINLINMCKILKSVDKNDLLSFEIDKQNKNTLKIKIKNNIQTLQTTYKLNFIEICESKYEYKSIPNPIKISINAKFFQKLIKDISSINGKYLTIKVLNNKVFFTTNDSCVTRETVIHKHDICKKQKELTPKTPKTPKIPKTKTKIKTKVKSKLKTKQKNILQFIENTSMNNIVVGNYDIQDLLTTCKFTNLNKNIILHLQTDYPLYLFYKIENIGEILLIIKNKF